MLCKVSDIDESSVMQLAEMGFPLEACRKAVYFTGNMGARWPSTGSLFTWKSQVGGQKVGWLWSLT